MQCAKQASVCCGRASSLCSPRLYRHKSSRSKIACPFASPEKDEGLKKQLAEAEEDKKKLGIQIQKVQKHQEELEQDKQFVQARKEAVTTLYGADIPVLVMWMLAAFISVTQAPPGEPHTGVLIVQFCCLRMLIASISSVVKSLLLLPAAARAFPARE